MDPVTVGLVELSYPLKNITLTCQGRRGPVSKKRKLDKIISIDESDPSDYESVEEQEEEEEVEEEEEETIDSNGRRQYEVESILDRCDFGNGEVYYLVKWKFWQSKYNTWEPEEHLYCKKRIKRYLNRVLYRSSERNITEIIESSVRPTTSNLENFLLSLQCEKEKVTLTVHSEYKLRTMACSVCKTAKNKRGLFASRLERLLLVKYLFVRRSRQLVALKEWEEEINRVSNDIAPLIVENETDLEWPPDNFFYVTQYIPGPNVIIPDDPPVGCKCRICDVKSNCCSSLAKFRFAYSAAGTLRISPNTPIYECNKRCKCKSHCSNRVVQKGRNIKVSIFRTTDNRGWGVKTLEDIKKGTYVCTYLGEVIHNTDAEARIDKYQNNQHTYLFDMDYNGANHKYTVDANDYGTIARFVNHSCQPNLVVCFVWIDCLDPSLPNLVFFSSEFIPAGQELTIDYVGDLSRIDANIIRKTKPCRCGSENCKKIVF